MNSPKLSLRTVTTLLYLTVFAAIPALAAPKKAASPTPAASASPSASASATPEAKVKPFPFKNTVISVDKAARSFRIGKKTVHQVYVLPETKVIKVDETPATFEEIVVGVEVRGSVKKRADGEWEAVSIKIVPKTEASPSASPAAKASPSPAPSPKP